jgi:single-strand DNA-binding protein
LVELYGRIGVNAYKDMEGEPKAALTFHVNNIKLHGGSKQEVTQTNTVAPVSANGTTEQNNDDLPF